MNDITHIDPRTITIQHGLPLRAFDVADNKDDAMLASDIERRGLQEPLTVLRGLDGSVILTAGFRRLSAVWVLIDKGCSIPTVPCLVVEPQDKKGLPL